MHRNKGHRSSKIGLKYLLEISHCVPWQDFLRLLTTCQVLSNYSNIGSSAADCWTSSATSPMFNPKQTLALNIYTLIYTFYTSLAKFQNSCCIRLWCLKPLLLFLYIVVYCSRGNKKIYSFLILMIETQHMHLHVRMLMPRV